MKFPAKLETIGKFAFSENPVSTSNPEQDGLTKVTFPETLKSIGQQAFSNNRLTEVVLPDSVETLGAGAFTGNAGTDNNKIHIEKLTLSKNLKEIAGGAFAAQRIENIVIPEGVETIGASAFAGNRAASVSIPGTLKSIGDRAFQNEQFTELDIPANVETIGKGAFAYTNTSAGESQLTKLTLHEGLKEIGRTAFQGNKLTKIVLPTTVTKLGKDSFKDNGSEAVTLGAKVKDQANAAGDYTGVVTTGTGHKVVYLPKVTFHGEGGTPETAEVNVNFDGKLDEMPKAERDGYTFTGWFTAAEGGESVSADTAYTDDTDVYAQWKQDIIKAQPAVTLSTTKYTYNGKVRKPSVKVSVDGKELAADQYDITYPNGRKNVGKYRVTVTLKGQYEGTGSASFKISPKSTSLKKLTKGNRSFKAVWKKQSPQVTGYQLQYSTSKKFTKKTTKTSTVKSYKTVKKTVKKLKKNKKYYVRIRTYKKAGGVKYNSKWSKVKAVRTK